MVTAAAGLIMQNGFKLNSTEFLIDVNLASEQSKIFHSLEKTLSRTKNFEYEIQIWEFWTRQDISNGVSLIGILYYEIPHSFC